MCNEMDFYSVKSGIMKKKMYQWLIQAPSIPINTWDLFNTSFDII